MQRSALDRYARTGHRNVEGWLLTAAIDALSEIFRVQSAARLTGSVCEIGVHHGRLFILLCLTTSANELAVAYDLFARQNGNVDGSGHGDLRVFLDNLERHHCDRSRVRAIETDSKVLNAERVIADCGSRPRLFSIDGGHTAEITNHDLHTAHHAICRGGVIILDDFFNEQWPGVAEGTCRYMSHPTDLVPIAIVGNKVLLTNDAEWAEKYKRSVATLKRHYLTKTSQLFGYEVLVLWREHKSLQGRIRDGLDILRAKLLPRGLRSRLKRLLRL